MSIIEELRGGTFKSIVKEDGTETVEGHPPTSLALRAANTIKAQQAQLEGLSRAYKSLEIQYTRNLEEFQKLYEKCSMVSERVVDERLDSIRPVSGVTEKPGSEDQT